MSSGRDWVEWHRAYEDPDSSLSQRLGVVARMIRNVLDSAPPGDIRLLSLCAGDGRDLALAATDHPRAVDLTGLLADLDPHLAGIAAINMRGLSDRLAVAQADAGVTSNYSAERPVDLLMLCGIFGNISDDDIRGTIAAVPTLCRPGATEIWTRHRREPDATSLIRRWFDEAGCRSVEFVSPGVGSFAIGREQVTDIVPDRALPDRLFTFVDGD